MPSSLAGTLQYKRTLFSSNCLGSILDVYYIIIIIIIVEYLQTSSGVNRCAFGGSSCFLYVLNRFNGSLFFIP